MHCVSIYPQDYSEANILKMKKLKSCKNVGLSDHIEGVESSKVAIGEGAVIVKNILQLIKFARRIINFQFYLNN